MIACALLVFDAFAYFFVLWMMSSDDFNFSDPYRLLLLSSPMVLCALLTFFYLGRVRKP